MKKQYKSPFEDPEAELWGIKIKDYKIPKRRKTLEERAKKPIIPDIEGYIYVPSIDLYVAKEKSLHNKTWKDTHKELHKKGLQMLTIRQFIDFILYLKQNKSSIPEAEKILNEILGKHRKTPQSCFRGEWLDAKFSREEGHFFHPSRPYTTLKKAGKLYISYNHRIVKGKLKAQNKEPLEKCLMEGCYIDLKSCNRQGLPIKKDNHIGYFYPHFVQGEEGHIAGFWTGPGWANLHCEWKNEPNCYIGVRAALKKKVKIK